MNCSDIPQRKEKFTLSPYWHQLPFQTAMCFGNLLYSSNPPPSLQWKSQVPQINVLIWDLGDDFHVSKDENGILLFKTLAPFLAFSPLCSAIKIKPADVFLSSISITSFDREFTSEKKIHFY